MDCKIIQSSTIHFNIIAVSSFGLEKFYFMMSAFIGSVRIRYDKFFREKKRGVGTLHIIYISSDISYYAWCGVYKGTKFVGLEYSVKENRE